MTYRATTMAMAALALAGCKKTAAPPQQAPAVAVARADAKPNAEAAVEREPAAADEAETKPVLRKATEVRAPMLPVRIGGEDPTWSPSHRTAWFVDKQVCAFGPDEAGAPLAKRTCFEFPATARARQHEELDLGGAADGAPMPYILQDEHATTDTVRFVDTDAVIAHGDAVVGAFAWSRDAYDILLDDPAGYVLERHRGDAVTRAAIAVAGAGIVRPRLTGGALYVGATLPDGEHLRGYAFDRDHPPAQPFDLGAVGAHFANTIITCDSARRHAVWFTGVLGTAVDGKWEKPIPLPVDGDTEPMLTCDDARATAVGLAAGASYDRAHCTATACTHERISSAGAHWGEIGDLGEHMIMAWRIENAVRLHVATPAGWDPAFNDDRVLVDDADGARVDVVAGPGAALVFINRPDDKTQVYRVDDHAAVAPIH